MSHSFAPFFPIFNLSMSSGLDMLSHWNHSESIFETEKLSKVVEVIL